MCLRRHEEVYALHEEYKQQEKDRGDVIERLTQENEDKMKTLIDLETRIQGLEKEREKESNEIVSRYEGQLRETRRKGEERLSDNEVRIYEAREERGGLDETFKRRIYYETQLHHWRNQCALTEGAIQEERHAQQIEQARLKQALEAEYRQGLERFKQQAQADAERSKPLFSTV